MVLKELYVLSFINIFSVGLFIPVQSNHVISLGGTKFTRGLLGSVHSFLQLLLGPIIGSLSDTKGRKPLLYLTCIGLIIADLLLLVKSLNIFLLSRIIYGCSCHIQLLVKALVTDYVKPEEQVEIFGKIGAFTGLAFIIGPIISGHILDHDYGFEYLVTILAVLNVTAYGLSVNLPPSPKTAAANKPSQPQSGPLSKLKEINWNTYWDVFSLKLLAEFGFSLYFQTFGPYLIESFNTSPKELGYIIAYFSLCMILSNLSIEKITKSFYADDHSFKKRNLHGLAGLGTSFAILYALPTFWMYIAVIAPLGMFKTLLDRIWIEVVVMRSTDDNKGTVMGAFESLVQMAGLVAPVISGIISNYYGYNAVLGVSTMPLIVAICIVLGSYQKTEVKKE